MLTRKRCAFFLSHEIATRKNVHQCVSEKKRVKECVYVCAWEREKKREMENKLPVSKMILIVTAPYLTFNTEVLSIRFYAMRNKSMRHSQAISIDCCLFFLPYFMRLPFEIVNILVFFLSLYIFFSSAIQTLQLPAVFLFLFRHSYCLVMRADFYSRLNNVETHSYSFDSFYHTSQENIVAVHTAMW